MARDWRERFVSVVLGASEHVDVRDHVRLWEALERAERRGMRVDWDAIDGPLLGLWWDDALIVAETMGVEL